MGKHIAAGTAKIELFWKAHERTRQFDQILKNLLERMLHPYAEYRYDIKHIKLHKWYKGKLYTNQELRKYLQQRVRTVVKERAVKIKKQLEEQGVTSVEKYSRRDPTSTQHKQSPMEIRAKELDPNNQFVKYMDHVKDDLFVNTFYQFFTYCAPAEIAARVERIADRAGAKITISPKNNITLIRCAVAFDDKGSGDEDVIFACKQFLVDDSDYQDDETSDNDDEKDEDVEKTTDMSNKRYVVSFKRLQGSHLAYQKA